MHTDKQLLPMPLISWTYVCPAIASADFRRRRFRSERLSILSELSAKSMKPSKAVLVVSAPVRQRTRVQVRVARPEAQSRKA